jgi:hypothetical protein
MKLAGKKSYLAAIGIALVTFAKAKGYIDGPTHDLIIGLLAAFGLAALRAGIGKI